MSRLQREFVHVTRSALSRTGTTQRVLARRMGVAPTRIPQMLRRENTTLRTVERVGAALGVRIRLVDDVGAALARGALSITRPEAKLLAKALRRQLRDLDCRIGRLAHESANRAALEADRERAQRLLELATAIADDR